MSLTKDDLQQIRSIVREEVDSAIDAKINPRLGALEQEVKAIHNDLKEIYDEIEGLKALPSDSTFAKLSLEQQLRVLHKGLMTAAKQAGIDLSQ